MKFNFIISDFYRKILGSFKNDYFFSLLYIIINSYKTFFYEKNEKNLKHFTLDSLLRNIFPIKINHPGVLIKYMNFKLLPPINSFYYCIKNGLTYSSLLRIKFCILHKSDSLKEFIKCQYLDIANIPLITENSTFVINGVEKVIISKLVRAPGVYFSINLLLKQEIFIIRMILNDTPNLEFYINESNFLILKILKFEISILFLLKYLGSSDKEIMDNFYNYQFIVIVDNNFKLKFVGDYFLGISIPFDITDLDNNILVPKNKILEEHHINIINSNNIDFININESYLLGKFLGNDIFLDNNILLLPIGTKLDNFSIFKIKCFRISDISLVYISSNSHSSVVLTLFDSKKFNIFEIINNVNDFFLKVGFVFLKKSFLNFSIELNKRFSFDFSFIRSKFNLKLKRGNISGPSYFKEKDFIDIIRFLILFKDGLVAPDDMHNLNSMNLLLVGDMLYDIFKKFLFILKKNIINKLFFLKKNQLYFLPSDFLKFNLFDFEIKKFFNISKYSQFLDQTNILSELSHKRRVTLLGIPGISKKHSGFNVRDLNFSYYSKLCPVETPEGINIGLVSSLALFALVNRKRELVSPYYRIIKKKNIGKNIYYLSNDQESNMIFSDYIFRLNTNLSPNSIITARCNNQLILTKYSLVDFIDVFPFQILSVCSSLIPFIEYNDPNRALMASNMLKQALPCLFPQKPIIATGLESLIAFNSNTLVFSNSNGIVKYIDSDTLILKKYYKKNNIIFNEYDFYFLYKNLKSNQNTDISQRFIVNLNDNVLKNDILADGSCTDKGELSLGQNMLVAFMSWGGYNFEDSLVVSEKVVINERYTSLENFDLDINIYSSCDLYDVLTKNIDSKDPYFLKNLDEFGIIKPGTLVSSNDLLISKKTFYLKKENLNISNEVLLFNKFFLKKDHDFIDTSFYLPNNFSLSLVKSVEVYFSKDIDLNCTDKLILKRQSFFFLKNKKILFNKFIKKIKLKLKKFFFNKEVIFKNDNFIISDLSFFNKKSINFLLNLSLSDVNLNFIFKKFSSKFIKYLKNYRYMCKNVYNKFLKILPVNVSKLIRFCFIKKKILQVGDKMSGRHGNKGVVSKIVPVNYMPYMSDGTPIDIILNPLGVPSRMNIGQLLEVRLGFISFIISFKVSSYLKSKNMIHLKNFIIGIYSILKDDFVFKLKNASDKFIIKFSKKISNGFYFTVPCFTNFKEYEINELLDYVVSDLHNLNLSSNKREVYLYDGKTGKKFEQPVTVGFMYILKLNHLSQDKIHSRSTGPYSLITQQPLKGKVNNGGQRIGEMEVWALEAYGASYTLRDMMTVKSDDIIGRKKAYESIISGSLEFDTDKPESFLVMMSYINSLGIYIRFIE